MTAFKRIKHTITASFDYMVSMLENHEALVEATIKEANHAAANANVQLKKIKSEGIRMQEKITELKAQSLLWQERTVQAANQDKDKALECLKRKKLQDIQILEYEKAIKDNQALEIQLSKDYQVIEKKLEELKRKKQAYKSREASANAMQSLASSQSGLITEIDDIFDRWDSKIYEAEATISANHTQVDQLSIEFSNQEERASLEAELNALLTK